MQPADLPFSDQIIRGKQECEDATATLLDSTIDASVVLTSAEMKLLPMRDFNLVLKRFTDQDSKQLGKITSALDRSQAAAIHSAMTHRLTVIQGPPGTGKSYTIVRLLRLLDSIKGESHGESHGESGPVLVLTYKNRSLEVRARHIQAHNPHTTLVKIFASYSLLLASLHVTGHPRRLHEDMAR
jgi:predicted ATPase with chaperone activity